MAAESVRILGIDPGSQITGFGVVEAAGNRTTAVEWGSIRTEGEHSERLRSIFQTLGRIVREFKPMEIAIERVFLHRNADSALKLGQARAAAICATFECRRADLRVQRAPHQAGRRRSRRRGEAASAAHGADDPRRARRDSARRGGRARGGDLSRERTQHARLGARRCEDMSGREA